MERGLLSLLEKLPNRCGDLQLPKLVQSLFVIAGLETGLQALSNRRTLLIMNIVALS